MLGSILLPFGDFSATDHIANMYKHCKETEDKDMTIVDFVTDHLVNIDGLFDEHSHGDDQKPHHFPNQQHLSHVVFFFTSPSFDVPMARPVYFISKAKKYALVHSLYSFSFYNKIFHPPATV